MTAQLTRRSHTAESLRRVRVRLTAWYAGTFAAILLVIGTGMFSTITRRYDHELDESLEDTSRELIRVLHARESSSTAASVLDSTEFHAPERLLYVTDARGRPVTGTTVSPWISDLARVAAGDGRARRTHPLEEPGHESSRVIRAYAEATRLRNGDTLVVVTAADEIEIEDRYAALILTFSLGALAALLLVAAGGWFVAQRSTAPIERSIQHMRRFMADAAHELRTPLTILRSNAEVMLQRPRETGDYQAALQTVESESARLSGIVEDLLLLARADSGERPIQRRQLFLDEILLDAAESAAAMADRESVNLSFGDLPETAVMGDPALLLQLVIILLDNAIKYTPAGGSVHVGLARDSATASLTVTDTGIGIAAEHLPLVFDRFYRVDPARSRGDGMRVSSSEGVGLGLSIARWIAEQHGAALSLTSSAGTGTTATVTFPLASLPTPADDRPSA